MRKFLVILVLAFILPPWVIGFLLIGIPVLMGFGLLFGGGAYGLIKGGQHILKDGDRS